LYISEKATDQENPAVKPRRPLSMIQQHSSIDQCLHNSNNNMTV